MLIGTGLSESSRRRRSRDTERDLERDADLRADADAVDLSGNAVRNIAQRRGNEWK